MTLPSSMKAARFEEVNEPLQIEEMPIPVPPTDFVRLRSRSSDPTHSPNGTLSNWSTLPRRAD